MNNKAIKRTRYFEERRNPLTDKITIDHPGHTTEDHYNDLEDFHLPLSCAHHAYLHGWGIAAGLEVSAVGNSKLEVKPGVAVDGQGRLMVLGGENKAYLGDLVQDEDQKESLVPVQLDLQAFPDNLKGKRLCLTLDYHETLRLNEGAGGRLEQTPQLSLHLADKYRDEGPAVVLGIVVVDESGGVTVETKVPDLNYGRRFLGHTVPGNLHVGGSLSVIGATQLSEVGVNGSLSVTGGIQTAGSLQVSGATQLAEARTTTLSVAGQTSLTGGLTVAGNVGIGTTAPNERLLVTGGRIGQLEAGTFGHGWSKWVALGVPNLGLPPTHANYYGLKIQWDSDSVVFGLKDYGANRKDAIIAWGDDANDNLRFLRPNDADAMIITGSGHVGIGTDSPNRQLTIQGDAGTYLNVKAENGSKEVLLGADRGGGIVSTMTNDDLQLRAGGNNTKMTIKANGNVGIGTSNPLQKLHVAGNFLTVDGAGNEQVYIGGDGWGNDVQLGSFNRDVTNVAVWNETTKTRMNLFVNHLIATGDVRFSGKLIGGGKGGYVMDQFVNNRGESLEQGDVVVIGENQTSLYYGQDNTIPVPEVDLAQQAYDTRVCGIVSEVYTESKEISESLNIGTTAEETAQTKVTHQTTSEAVPSQTFTVEELSSLDRTKIEPGQIGWMVTLGSFAYCKVDADLAPIAVGDLLTTSPTKGHAQKVVEPGRTVGAILGKALGALDKGKGKIPVLVMLQ